MTSALEAVTPPSSMNAGVRRGIRFWRWCASALVSAAAMVGCTSSSLTSTNPTPVKCQLSVDTATRSVGAAGGTTRFGISAQPECGWTAASQASWIAEVKPASGQGSQQIEVTVTANADPAVRQGTVNVNGVSLRITQEAAACTFDVSPTGRSSSAASDSATVSVTTAATCGWTAKSDADWISVTSPGGLATAPFAWRSPRTPAPHALDP